MTNHSHTIAALQNRIAALEAQMTAMQKQGAHVHPVEAPPYVRGWAFPKTTMSDDLKAVLEKANAAVEAMTPEQQAAMWKAQRESYVHGEMELSKLEAGMTVMGKFDPLPPPPVETVEDVVESICYRHGARTLSYTADVVCEAVQAGIEYQRKNGV